MYDMNSYYVYYYYYKARTPLVLGTSSPPVLLIAIRIARASALNADSALTSQTLACYPFFFSLVKQASSHVVVVFSSDRVNVKGYTGGKGKRLKKVRHHFRRYYRI